MEESSYWGPENFDRVKRLEFDFIQEHRRSDDKRVSGALTGLALSGGGIRSATFNLGVVQALAKRGLLGKIDYLSTVSGGGYIGSSLTWFLSPAIQQNYSDAYSKTSSQDNDNGPEHQLFGTSTLDFPYGTDEPGHFISGTNSDLQNGLLDHLRRRGNFLTPGDNYTFLTLMAVAIRTALLSLMTWAPLIGLVMYSLMIVGTLNPGEIPLLFRVALYLGLASIVGFIIISTLLAILVSFNTDRGDDEKNFGLRLFADKCANSLLNWALALIGLYCIASIGVDDNLGTRTLWYTMITSISGPSILAGLCIAISVVFKPDSAITTQLLLPTAAGLLIFGLLLAAFQIAYAARLDYVFEFDKNIIGWDFVFFTSVLIALIFCLGTNLNDISIARFYRDRIKETFLPAAESLKSGTNPSLSIEIYLKDLCKKSNSSHYPGPYHIINSNVILADSPRPKHQRRGGDSFILSPLFCGSGSTGWQLTEEFYRGELTLGTAVAISGAAVNPSAGPGGRGITRNRFISFVLAVLNLRLGVWVPNPNPKIRSWASFLSGKFLQSAWYGSKSWLGFDAYHEKAVSVQLTDGGHFENLGLYELIRRELDLIIVSDATADPCFTFADMRRALRFAETDFKVEISLDDQQKLHDLMPNEGQQMGSPMAEARKGYLTAKIRYSSEKEGRLIYIKSTMVGGQRIRTKSYKLEYPRFPDQPTSDQFFDEAQFAAYRDLGYTITWEMLDTLGHTKLDLLERRSGEDRRTGPQPTDEPSPIDPATDRRKNIRRVA